MQLPLFEQGTPMNEDEIDRVNSVDIDEQMRMSFLDYAMSVIVSRALPDARDGLKPRPSPYPVRHARYGYSFQQQPQEICPHRW